MKTVQEWLREVDEKSLVDTYCYRYPVDFVMLENKDVTVRQVLDRQREVVRAFVRELKSLEVRPSADGKTGIFFGCKFNDKNSYEPTAYLCYLEDIVREVRPEHYSCMLTDFSEVMGYLVADTPYTLRHISDVLVEILSEISLTGYTQEGKKHERARLDEAMQESERGESCPAEEMWKRFGIEPEPEDEEADKLRGKVYAAEHEHNEFCFLREVRCIRQALSEGG